MFTVKFYDESFSFNEAILLSEFFKMTKRGFKYTPLGAYRDNTIVGLNDIIYGDCSIREIDISKSDGLRIYAESLSFVISCAAKNVFPKDNLYVQNSLSGGLYFQFEKKRFLNFNDVRKLKDEMQTIINKDIEIKKETMEFSEGYKYFKPLHGYEGLDIIKDTFKGEISVYSMNGIKAYFPSVLVPRTSYLKLFDIVYYPTGVILLYPNPSSCDRIPEFNEQKKIYRVFNQYNEWQNVLKIQDVSSLNQVIKGGDISQLIKISEIIHEKKIGDLAESIKKDKNVRLILISGPSSSGKTTFTKRLSLHLHVLGIKTAMISLDNYFVDRNRTPIDDCGSHDFEHIKAIDIELFNEHLISLFEGKEIDMPTYNFKTGMREYKDKKLKLDFKQVILIEGIHGLNPELTVYIPEIMKFKIYISALTQLNIDGNNRIPTTDTRLIRRMIRDSKFRKYSAEDTLRRWPSVRKGEEKWIFPFQENADYMVNSALVYELPVLKKEAESLLKNIGADSDLYSESRRILNLISYLLPIETDEIPPTSILREFIGNSSFKY